MPLVIPLGEAHGDAAWRCGPKAAHLSLLKEVGFPVPSGLVVVAEALDLHLEVNGLVERVAALLDTAAELPMASLPGVAAALSELITAVTPPDALVAEARSALGPMSGVPLSVRSSSTMEDRPDVTFAGQHDSFLNIISEEGLWEALTWCWASLWSPRALQYMRALDVSPREVRMAVLIQELVPAEKAGVAFTINPTTGADNHVVVSAARGLGEGVVSGQVTPDQVTVQREPRELLEYQAGKQTAAVAPTAGGGTAEVPLTADDKARPVLTEAEALQVADLALQVEESVRGVPQDVEWAIQGGVVSLLQARPMVLARPGDGAVRWESPVPGAHWRRNWRLGEWLTEPVTPLFNTWLVPVLVASREEFGTGEMGWETRRSFSMPQPWFCIVNGYFYARQDRPAIFGQGTVSPLQRILERALASKGLLERWQRTYLPGYLERIRQHQGFDVRRASSRESVALVDTLVREAGEFWYLMAPIGYGFEESAFNPIYESLVPEGQRAPYTDLFAGFPSLAMQGQQALYALAQGIKADARTAEWLLGRTPQQAAASLTQLPAHVQQHLAEYMEQYGHQVYNLDIFFPTVGEAPEGTMAAIQSYLRHEATSPQVAMELVARRREQAVRSALDALNDDPAAQADLRVAIEGFQANAAIREEAAFYFQWPWPLMRRATLELGERLAKAGVLSTAEEAFFLEKDELTGSLATLETGEDVPSLHQVVMGRRRRWEHQRKLDPPGQVPMVPEATSARAGAGGRTMAGQSASPGVGRGPARIVQSPQDMARFAKGDILVTRAASPALTPLLLLAAGMVTEAGGGASHSSLLARELGVPAVVNVDNATRAITDGQVVEVDGTRGTVRLLRRTATAS